MTRANVPCGDCRLCCKLMTPLHPERGDDPSSYLTAMLYAPGKPPQLILDRLPNGDCVYLTEQGCAIHDRAPVVCQEFDCRDAFRKNSRQDRKWAIKNGLTTNEIVERGRELLFGKPGDPGIPGTSDTGLNGPCR